MSSRSRYGAGTARGFSLAELAIVLLILVVLAGGVIAPLTAQVEQRRREEAVRALAEIKEAIIGFAVLNGRLPCPALTTDPSAATYGEESFNVGLNICQSIGIASDGFLPWRTLGLSAFDPWGSPRRTTSDGNFGHWRYRVDEAFARTGTAAISLAPPTAYTANLNIYAPRSTTRLNTDNERPIAIVFSTGANRVADLDNLASYSLSTDAGYTGTVPVGYVAAQTYNAGPVSSGFDDITVWIGRPQLYARMVAAGKLP